VTLLRKIASIMRTSKVCGGAYRGSIFRAVCNTIEIYDASADAYRGTESIVFGDAFSKNHFWAINLFRANCYPCAFFRTFSFYRPFRKNIDGAFHIFKDIVVSMVISVVLSIRLSFILLFFVSAVFSIQSPQSVPKWLSEHGPDSLFRSIFWAPLCPQ
jgi:hypothetical protein